MQTQETEVGFNEIIASYPTIEHFHKHYVNQGLNIRLLHDISKIFDMELYPRDSYWKEKTDESCGPQY